MKAKGLVVHYFLGKIQNVTYFPFPVESTSGVDEKKKRSRKVGSTSGGDEEEKKRMVK